MQRQMILEEIANSITHGIGVILSIIGLITFFLLQTSTSDIWRIIGFSIFGVSLILMYIFSTLSHSFIFTKARNIFMMLDHSSIFLLIAGTYSYFLLTVLRGVEGWSLFSIIWLLSIAGIIWKAFYVDRYRIVTVILYLTIGWLCVFVAKPLWQNVGHTVFLLLLAGGLFYSLGTIFYSNRKLPFSHAIWHIFVLVGSALHFAAIFLL